MHYQPSYRMSRREHLAMIDFVVNPGSRESRLGRSVDGFDTIKLLARKTIGLGGRKFTARDVMRRDARVMFGRTYIPSTGETLAEVLREAPRLPVSES